ncbi:transposase family protein [Streptomyces coelicoflavus]|uniref:transposase family protein n=1 Tax=Streptomyces coelicoflavus TaxID=285562 RepID=UPI003813C125
MTEAAAVPASPPISDAAPFAAEYPAHPEPLHRRLREAGPVVRLSRYDVHVLARHQEVRVALVDWQTFQSGAGVGLAGFRHEDPVIITGRKAIRNHRLTDAEKEANRLISRERAVGEHGFAHLESWHILTKVRTNARHATTLLRALLVLANTGSGGDRRSPRSDHDADRQESVTPGPHRPRELRNQDETTPLVVRGVRRTYPGPERRASSRTSRSAQ